MNFLRTLFAREPSSAQLAKQRLQVVLVQDHLSLPPGKLAAIKADLLAVLSRHLEIDPDGVEVSVERRGHSDELIVTSPVKRNLGQTRGGEPIPVERPSVTQSVGRSVARHATGSRAASRRRH